MFYISLALESPIIKLTDRFNSTFVSKEDACKHSQYKTDKEKTGKIKPKTQHGKFENYEFKKEFISEIKSYPPNNQSIGQG